MSGLERKMKGFVESYKTCLENRIEHGDSILVCGDRELIGEVGGLLQDRDAPNIHSLLGLNPLKVMEESLLSMQSSLPTTHGPHCIAKGGIGGLAKAFEVLELAALNLYLGPWRKEFKLVKMYSGMFTHHVKPVLSMPQILELFGLLGYEAGPTRCEELRLSSVGSSDSFRGLSFAFFAARCECRLLLTALGNHVGAMEWELGLVRERLKGRTLQVALDNTTRRLEASEPPEGDPLELSDVDLYTDDGQEEKRQEGERRQGVGETPRSPSWAERSSIVTSFSTPAAVTHSNGVPPSSSTPTSPREPVCVSTFNCQLAKTSPSGVSSSTAKSSPATATYTQQSGSTYAEPTRSGYERVDSYAKVVSLSSPPKLPETTPEGFRSCKCISSFSEYIQNCINCNTSHTLACDILKVCEHERHQVVFPDGKATVENRDKGEGVRLRSSQRGSLKEKECINDRRQVVFPDDEATVENRDKGEGVRLRSSQRGSLKEKECINDRRQVVFPDDEATVENRDKGEGVRLRSRRGSLKEKGVPANIAMSSPSLLLSASEAATSQTRFSPIPFHNCCDPAKPNPQFICISCWVFHSGSCKGMNFCRAEHKVHPLGVCSCGKVCVRHPLVLCRYCGTEYCNDCWYRRPVACDCGQTFDQSSSV